MVGVNDAAIKQKLLAKTPFPTLQEARTLCQSEEAAHANEKCLSGQTVAINAVRSRSSHQGNQDNSRKGNGNRCKACNRRTKHTDSETCPAIGRTCHYCGEMGHFTPCCPAKATGNPPVKAPHSTSGPATSATSAAKRIGTISHRRSIGSAHAARGRARSSPME